ncbi:MAG TPA: trigger factor, partial [Candidatus Dormibacteraeota bacterium]|nr:trigger factor [Candidatus Dormibacteraeota bacterium]
LGVRRDDPDAPNAIYDDAKEHLFESSILEALRDQDLDVLEIPQPEWLAFAEGEGATYRVTLPVRPKVKLGAYLDYPFKPELEPVDDERVARVIEELRDQHATLVPVEARPAQADDYAVIGFEGRRDGQPFEGGSAERFPLVIGAERMVPGFEAQLVGLAEGEGKTFSLTFPEDYPDQALAGQPVEFSVTMRELRAKQLPPLDDEFAGQLGPYPDLDALRTDIRARLEASARDRARHAFADRIIEFAVANATLDVPDLLIEREVEVMHDELRVRLAEQGIGYEEYLKVTGRDDAALHAEYRAPAEHRVKVLLVLSAIADQEGIEVEDAEIEAEIARARERYAKQPKLLAYFDSARGRSYLRSTMRRTKVVEELVDRWLAAHPEAGPLPHLEEEPTAVDPLAAAQEASAEQGSPA